MVERYNGLAKEGALAIIDAKAIEGDLCAEDLDESTETGSNEYRNFDIAVVCAGFHHLASPERAARRLAERLKSGGQLVILDFVPWNPADSAHAPAAHTITRHGFGEEEMQKIFEDAGLTEVGYKMMSHDLEMRINPDAPMFRRVFMARATKSF